MIVIECDVVYSSCKQERHPPGDAVLQIKLISCLVTWILWF